MIKKSCGLSEVPKLDESLLDCDRFYKTKCVIQDTPIDEFGVGTQDEYNRFILKTLKDRIADVLEKTGIFRANGRRDFLLSDGSTLTNDDLLELLSDYFLNKKESEGFLRKGGFDGTAKDLQNLINSMVSLDDLNRLINGFEPAFSKNTAFNKNFGDTKGTVAEGDHTHAEFREILNKLKDVNGQIISHTLTDSDLSNYTKLKNKNIEDGTYVPNTKTLLRSSTLKALGFYPMSDFTRGVMNNDFYVSKIEVYGNTTQVYLVQVLTNYDAIVANHLELYFDSNIGTKWFAKAYCLCDKVEAPPPVNTDSKPKTTGDITKEAPNRTNITLTASDFNGKWSDADGDALQAIRVEGSPSDIARLKLNNVPQRGSSFDITNVSNFTIEYEAKDTDPRSETQYAFKVKTNGVWSD